MSSHSHRLRLALTVVSALCRLAFFDYLARRGFGRAHAFVRGREVRSGRHQALTTGEVVWAVEEACVWYVKRAYCLQRSAVTTWMLRREGVPAQLVIAVRHVPAEWHAWVEVDGEVVNDRPQYQTRFRVVDRL